VALGALGGVHTFLVIGTEQKIGINNPVTIGVSVYVALLRANNMIMRGKRVGGGKPSFSADFRHKYMK
jgi:hypothetical protein